MMGKCTRCKRTREITKKTQLCKGCYRSIKNYEQKTEPKEVARLERRVAKSWKKIYPYIPSLDD